MSRYLRKRREHVNMFFIDVSGSLDFGGGERTKKRVIVELFATVAFSCSMNQDKIGAVFFSDEVVKYFVPKKGKKHVWSMLKYLIENDFKSKYSDPSSAFDFFQKTKWKNIECFCLVTYCSLIHFRVFQHLKRQNPKTRRS